MARMLLPGTLAPDFTLHVTPDQTISLNDYRGKPLIILFYPADWSPVCSDEILLFNELLSEFHKYQAEIIGISVDSAWCHNAFAEHRHIHFSLLSDFEPKGEVAKKYGVFKDKDGICERALFLINKEGIIEWSYLSPMGKNPGAEGVLEALELLSSKTV